MKFPVLQIGLYGAVAGVPLATIGLCNALKTGSWDIAFPCVVAGVAITASFVVGAVIGGVHIEKDDFER